jgi:hypothetical protein
VVKWNDDGTFGMGPGWGRATNVRFDANVYLKSGHVEPMEANAKVVKDAGLEGIDWKGPAFDAVRDGGKMNAVDAYFEAHGRWMREMFRQARVM